MEGFYQQQLLEISDTQIPGEKEMIRPEAQHNLLGCDPAHFSCLCPGFFFAGFSYFSALCLGQKKIDEFEIKKA